MLSFRRRARRHVIRRAARNLKSTEQRLQLTEKLEAHLAGESVVLDILTWTTKVALDVLGICKHLCYSFSLMIPDLTVASFRHEFGALEGKEDELAESLKKLA